MSKLLEPRKAFHPIEADLDDAVDQLAQRKGIPTLTVPELARAASAPASPDPDRRSQSVNPAGASEDSAGSRGPARAALRMSEIRREEGPEASPVTEYTSVKCRCPDYLLDQLHLVARRGRVTISHLILDALRAQGFFIREEDIVPDGRRIRGSRTR